MPVSWSKFVPFFVFRRAKLVELGAEQHAADADDDPINCSHEQLATPMGLLGTKACEV